MSAVIDETEVDKTRIETWEIQTNSTVWLLVRDPRDVTGYKKQRVGGRAGSRRIRLTTDDRRYNQEQVVDEMREHDPFTNGLLRLVDEKDRADDIVSTYHLSQDDLKEYLNIKDIDLFTENADSIKSELVLRRLYHVAEKEGTAPQVEALAELIDGRYSNAKDQEAMRDDSKGIRLTG